MTPLTCIGLVNTQSVDPDTQVALLVTNCDKAVIQILSDADSDLVEEKGRFVVAR